MLAPGIKLRESAQIGNRLLRIAVQTATLFVTGLIVIVMAGNESPAACKGIETGQAAKSTANRNSRRRSSTRARAANKNAAATAASPGSTFVIATTMGNITIELLDKDSPKTAENFRKLAETGFYNGLIFHRTISGFMIQGGDPNGNGTGGRTADGNPLPNEINRDTPLYQNGYHRGDMAMANRGRPETATSQFFIMHRDRGLMQLPPNYTIFARVTAGMDVVDKIANAPREPGSDRPVNPVKMTKVTVQKPKSAGRRIRKGKARRRSVP
jgi:cyclophilin family peptidyl-prolyl cis-trans isomerase